MSYEDRMDAMSDMFAEHCADCEHVLLSDASIDELIKEIDGSTRYGLLEKHIIILEEITREWRETH